MSVSSDLIAQLVKVTNDSKPAEEETTVYGTIKTGDGGKAYVMLDGSDLLTPITTTAVVRDGDRVTVMIKNHTAVVTGNVTSPSAAAKDVDKALEAVDKISEFEIIVAYRVTTDELNAIDATITNLKAAVAKFGDVTAVNAEIEKFIRFSQDFKNYDNDLNDLKSLKLNQSDFKEKYSKIYNVR